MQQTVGGGQNAQIELQGAPATDPLHLALLQHAQNLGLQRQRHLGNLIEQQGATVGLLEFARLALVGAGEGALLMAEQRRFEHVLGNGGAVDRDEGLAGTGRVAVDETGQLLLAGAALATDQHIRIALCHPLRQRQQASTAGGLGQRIMLVNRYCCQMTPHRFDQPLAAEGFDQIVGRILPHRLHRLFDRAVGGHQHHRQHRSAALDLLQQLMAIHAGHVDVTQQQAGLDLFEPRQRRLARIDAAGIETGQLQGFGQGLGQIEVILDHQNGCPVHHGFGSRIAGWRVRCMAQVSHCTTGSRSSARAPPGSRPCRPGRSVSRKSPWWARATASTTGRPRPVPLLLVV